jgi:tRNA pseudouridine55 synthase
MPAARAPRRDVRGILLLDKPHGATSNQALQRAKRLFEAAKAGHSGSLDPLATGVLPVCFGAATRLAGFLLDARKGYAVGLRFGIATATGDAEGEIVAQHDGPAPPEQRVRAALEELAAVREQVPPMYSALKRDGAPLYRLARRGIEVPRAPRPITIYEIELAAYRWPELEFRVTCSKGTYVRTLVTDLAALLGTVGHVRSLRRTSLGPYDEPDLSTFAELERLRDEGGLAALDAELVPLDSALAGWPRVVLAAADIARLIHGQSVPAASDWPRGRVSVYGEPFGFVAIGEVTPAGVLIPRRVLAP